MFAVPPLPSVRRSAATVAFLAGTVLAPPAVAGGGVMLAGNPCVVSVGFYDIHFTAYQPRTRGDEGFCSELPDTGETLIVLDYLHDSLREAPLELRVVRDPTGLGRFVRVEDVEAVDLAAHTVFHRPGVVEADGSYEASVVLEQPGDYLVVITAGHPTKPTTYTEVFALQAGVGGFPYLWLAAAVALLAAGVGLFLALRARRRPVPAVRASS